MELVTYCRKEKMVLNSVCIIEWKTGKMIPMESHTPQILRSNDTSPFRNENQTSTTNLVKICRLELGKAWYL